VPTRPILRPHAARKPAVALALVAAAAALLLSACNLGDLLTTSTGSIAWAWEDGTGTADFGGTYGTLGTAGGTPGARQAVARWTDSAGNLWLFGGYGYPVSGTPGYLNDLWEYTPSSGKWTWVGGPDTDDSAGVYGTLGVAAATNGPGAREGAASWVDAAGNFWLFGGEGYDTNGVLGDLNDLWEYSPTTGLWTWVGGAAAADGPGTYGTLHSPSPSNLPGSRQFMATWTDSSGKLWLFGGVGFDGSGVTGELDDLWMYDPTANAWTWEGGSTATNAAGVYGTRGSAAAGNLPGARAASSYWTDPSGNFWLFAGSGYDASGKEGYLNDLWEFSPTSGEWTWVSGASSVGAAGVYGTQGKASSSTVPGARAGAATWADSSGNLWLLGGEGTNSAGNSDLLNDVWEFAPATGEWNWLSGSSQPDAVGAYGTEGKASTDNGPGSRADAASWVDPSGNFWLFGGQGLDIEAAVGQMNDLWKAKP
jgi:N-acetylneuraminic acid mutarotase